MCTIILINERKKWRTTCNCDLNVDTCISNFSQLFLPLTYITRILKAFKQRIVILLDSVNFKL